MDDNDEAAYEPTDEEKKEIEDMLNKEEASLSKKIKDRKLYTFNSKSHFIGWLKVNGIIW